MSVTAHPLQWPTGWPRAKFRDTARFSTRGADGWMKAVSIANARDRLQRELDLLGATYPTLSTNVELRLDGKPRSDRVDPTDVGAAVYFRLDGKDMALACDRWDRVADNIVAIAKHIEALRGMDRWGVGTAAQAFAGYEALPAPEQWWQVLRVSPVATPDDIAIAYRFLAREAHPDRPSGSHTAMARLNAAGRSRGADDDRWLLDRVIDVVRACRPSRVFRENVPGNADGQLRVLVPALEGLGYRVAAGLFSAKELGFAHGRERLFVMANRTGQHRGLHARPWLSDIGSSNTRRNGEALADGAGGGCRECRNALGAGCRGHAHCCDPVACRELAIAERGDGAARTDRSRTSANCGADDQSGRSGVDVADTAGGRREPRTEKPARGIVDLPGSGRSPFSGDGGGRVADAGSARLQGDELDRACDDERFGSNAHGSAPELRGACFPLLAPGPSDGRWPDIIARAPHLEPAVRRVAHGMADRVDRLRACGNGVVPLVAGYAWRTLEARLAADAASGGAVVNEAA